MKFYYKMPKSLKVHYKNEMANASMAFRARDCSACWYHLERAHILGQPYPMQHTAVHWSMLCFGFRTKNLHEIVGQLPRLLFGGVKSFVGKIPTGNTGGANVSALKPMPISQELRDIINTNIL